MVWFAKRNSISARSTTCRIWLPWHEVMLVLPLILFTFPFNQLSPPFTLSPPCFLLRRVPFLPSLLLAPLPRSGTRLRRSSIRSTTTSTSFLQLPTTAAPSSFTQLPLLLEVRMSTPYCWHHSLARVCLRRSSIRSTTLHVSCSDHSFKTCS